LDTTYVNGIETLEDPSYPGDIAWYPRFGHPGYGGGTNSLFAGHVNYYRFGNGPFAYLTSAQPGDALYVTMADGEEFAYTVESVRLLPLDELTSGGMQDVVFPELDSHTERVTLISCGGDFIPFGGGGGEYTSRVVLVAERWVP
jgi:sortase (surface protein transpeptidase)